MARKLRRGDEVIVDLSGAEDTGCVAICDNNREMYGGTYRVCIVDSDKCIQLEGFLGLYFYHTWLRLAVDKTIVQKTGYRL